MKKTEKWRLFSVHSTLVRKRAFFNESLAFIESLPLKGMHVCEAIEITPKLVTETPRKLNASLQAQVFKGVIKNPKDLLTKRKAIELFFNKKIRFSARLALSTGRLKGTVEIVTFKQRIIKNIVQFSFWFYFCMRAIIRGARNKKCCY